MFSEDYEEFTAAQKSMLERFVTSTTSHVFVLRNLPEVIKGALFSRYSRSTLGLRSLLLKEFISNNEEASFTSIVGDTEGSHQPAEDQLLAIQKAQNFYDRILDGYGDDSIGELGGAHLAIENISMLAANHLEHARIGGSPLEKSTRYIYFDQKVKGEYLYYREPILMTSAFKNNYLETCELLFDTYSKMIAPLTEQFEAKYLKDPAVSQAAYAAATRAKVLDCIRGLLPVSTLTNMGLFGNGRFFEQLLHKAECSPLAEMQDLGKRMYEELAKVIPSFIRRANPSHRTHINFAEFHEAMEQALSNSLKEQELPLNENEQGPLVKLIEFDPESPSKVAAGLLYPYSNHTLEALQDHCKTLSAEELDKILEAGCSARENRRNKSPRGLEHATFTFEITADFGVFRDLHRHRILTQDRQLLNCSHGYFIPPEILNTPHEHEYRFAMEKAKEAYELIANDLPEEAQYLVPMAYHIRWYFHVNLRALQWLCELRSSPAGHPNYRYVAQAMAQEVCKALPQFEKFFRFVDYGGYDMGRLGQEQRKQEKALQADYSAS